MYQSVGCLYKVKIQVKIRYLAIESTECDHVWMLGPHENPEESWRLPWDLANSIHLPETKKNQTQGCLRIYHHHSGSILLVLVRCTCFCETHVQLWTFEHWVLYLGYTCLLGVPHGICEKKLEFMAGMKQEMQVSRVSQHSKYLMHSYLYLNKMWQFPARSALSAYKDLKIETVCPRG